MSVFLTKWSPHSNLSELDLVLTFYRTRAAKHILYPNHLGVGGFVHLFFFSLLMFAFEEALVCLFCVMALLYLYVCF